MPCNGSGTQLVRPLLRREHSYQDSLCPTTQGVLWVLRKSAISDTLLLHHIAHSLRCRSAWHLGL